MLITTVSGNQAMIKPNCEICARKQNTVPQADKPVYLDGHERFVRLVSNAAGMLENGLWGCVGGKRDEKPQLTGKINAVNAVYWSTGATMRVSFALLARYNRDTPMLNWKENDNDRGEGGAR